jgi:hypothetical protein
LIQFHEDVRTCSERDDAISLGFGKPMSPIVDEAPVIGDHNHELASPGCSHRQSYNNLS